MRMTLITVTHPVNKMELVACVRTMRAKSTEAFKWLIITEAENVAEVAALVPNETVLSMDYDARLQMVPNGYARQNAAKLMASKLVRDGIVGYVDDDVTAVQSWSPATFLDDNHKPVVYYQRSTHYPWMWGQMAVFNARCDRLFQLRLPLVMTAETLREVAGSRWGNMAMARWLAGDKTVSEFCVMGEASVRLPQCRDANRETYRNWETSRDHWAIDRKIFHDWQCDRRELRAAIIAGDV